MLSSDTPLLPSVRSLPENSSATRSVGLLVYYYVQYQLTRDTRYALATASQLDAVLAQDSVEKHDLRMLLLIDDTRLLPQRSLMLAPRIEEFERQLLSKVSHWASPPEWECLYRAVEVGYYLAYRHPSGALFKQWVALFTKHWSLATGFDRYARSEPVFLLGVEGLTGILLMLEAIARLTQTPVFREMIRYGVHYLLSFRQEVDFANHRYAVFPRLANVANQTAPWTSALGWSGSDLMQALLLYRAATLLQGTHLRKAADLIGLNTLLRREPKQTAMDGPNLYWGTAGIAQCYQALSRVSHRVAYQRGYAYWIDQTAQRLSNQPIAPEEYDLLHGKMGATLVLSLNQHPLNLAWSRGLLLT